MAQEQIKELRAENERHRNDYSILKRDYDELRAENERLRTNDFLGMGLIIKDQTAELERLHEDIAWKEKIIRTADVTMNKLRSENERLRERVAELQATSGYEASIAQVEIDRLRAALQRIADDGKNCQDYCRNQARRALEPKP